MYTITDGVRYCGKHPNTPMVLWGNNRKKYRCPACRSLTTRKRQENYKQKVFTVLGNRCATCGIDDWRVLQVDHVNGNGGMERKQYNCPAIYDCLARSTAYREYFYANLHEYQILCANCHTIKTRETGGYGSTRKYV